MCSQARGEAAPQGDLRHPVISWPGLKVCPETWVGALMLPVSRGYGGHQRNWGAEGCSGKRRTPHRGHAPSLPWGLPWLPPHSQVQQRALDLEPGAQFHQALALLAM